MREAMPQPVPLPPSRFADPGTFVDELFAWLTDRGATNYDPGVTQIEHALQSAALADTHGSADLTIAALLHDIGHLLVREHAQQPDFLCTNRRHESVGADWLQTVFPSSVSEPVRWHVDAKRYLCAVDRNYWDGLSGASKRSLEIQGGPMSVEEVRHFEAAPWAGDAVKLRQIDDKAKVPGWPTPPLASWKSQILSLVR